MAVITVSSLHGSGGYEMAHALAKQLRYRLVDRTLAEELSKQVGLTEAEAEVLHEGHHGPLFSLVDKLSSRMLSRNPRRISFARLARTFSDQPPFIGLLEEAILALAEDDNLVVLGWGGQVILSDIPRVAHVRCIARRQDRIQRVKTREKCTRVSAVSIMDRMERNSHRFIRHYWGRDWSDPELYDIVLNLSHLSIEAGGKLVLSLLEAKGLKI